MLSDSCGQALKGRPLDTTTQTDLQVDSEHAGTGTSHDLEKGMQLHGGSLLIGGVELERTKATYPGAPQVTPLSALHTVLYRKWTK